MTSQIDSYRFISRSTRHIMKSWVKREPARDIPWTPLNKSLDQCTVALISSAGIALKEDQPFDQEGERQNPWWGDPSFRIIPREATEEDVRFYHLHVDTGYAQEDINCVFPLSLLQQMAKSGEIGQSAPSHYSIMGYLLDETELLQETAPAIVDRLLDEEVDIVLLVPV